MKGRKTLRRAGIVLGLGALLCAGTLASGALGMVSIVSSATDSSSTATDTTTVPSDSNSTSTDSGTTSTDAATTSTDASTTSTGVTTTSPLVYSPSLSSDLLDYNPGQTVTLTGAGWQAAESVHIFVNDSIGQSWSYNADVTTDLGGGFTHQFQLPFAFISNYGATATGAAGGTASTTFTDVQINTTTAFTSLPGSVTYGNDFTIAGTVTPASGPAITQNAALTIEEDQNGTHSCAGPNFGGKSAITSALNLTSGSFSSGSLTPKTITFVNGTDLTGAGLGNYYVASGLSVGSYAFHAVFRDQSGPYQNSTSACSLLAVDKANTTTSGSGSPNSILTTGSTTVSWATSSSVGITGNTATGTVTVQKDGGPGALTCSPSSTSVNAAQTTGSGFSSNGSFSCSASAAGAYTYHVHFADSDGNYNNSDSSTVGLTVTSPDATPPTVTVTTHDAVPASGWFTSSPQQVDVSATDASNVTNISCTIDGSSASVVQSGSNPRTGTVSVSGNGTHPVVCTATDGAGNSGSAGSSNTVTVKIDTTPPTITFQNRTAPNANGWNGGNVTVNWSCSDGTSGVVSATASQTVSTEGSNQSTTGSCTDIAGNSASNTQSGINIDKTPPTISASATVTGGDAYASGDWTSKTVTVHFTCTDTLSGFATGACPIDVIVSSDTTAVGLNVSGNVTDKAGNGASSNTINVKVDTTSPTIAFVSATKAAGGAYAADTWTNDDVTVKWSCDDSLSGVTVASVQDVVNGEGAALSGSGTCHDQAGNQASASFSPVKIDRHAPTIAFDKFDPAANGNGWNKTSVDVYWKCEDSLSGPVNASVTHSIATEGADQPVTGTCTDNAGNSAMNTQHVSIDTHAPTISVASVKSNGADYSPPAWTNHDVVVTFACSDNGPSGVGTLTGPVTKGEGADQSATGTCTDKAGNSDSASVQHINVDKSPPTNIVFSGIIDGTIYPNANMPALGAISCDANYDISGKDSCTLSGYSSAIGAHTVTATAKDIAGNSATKQLNYTVGFKAGDILQPVLTASNSQGNPQALDLQAFKIKSTVPIKFRLYLDAAKTQLMMTPPAGSYAKLWFGKYDSTTDTSDSAEFVSAGSANTDGLFRWTGSPDYQYIYNLATAGNQQGTYGVQLTLYASDGTVLAQSLKQYFVLRN
jgi:hypothetical protein